MVLINKPAYAYLRSKIWSAKRKKGNKQNRFDVYKCDPTTTIPTLNGMITAPSGWYLATPNLKRDENILLVGSNTWGSSICLKIKWRPNEQLNLYTMLTSFTIECGKDKPIYDYNEVWTQSLKYNNQQQQDGARYIKKYSGQNITLEVLDPYIRYRLSFSGFMKDRLNNNKLVYVQFRSIVSPTGKLFDLKEQYDNEFVARQLIKKELPKGVDHLDLLNQLILHDRHEQSVQFRCVYSIGNDDPLTTAAAPGEQEEQKLFCWGFHARHFIHTDNSMLKAKFTRVLGYFSSGTSFHLGSVERSLDSKEEQKLQLDFGYACPQYQLTFPIQQLDPVEWDQISLNGSKRLQFKFKCDNITIEVKSSADPVNANSDFIDIVSNTNKKGRALIFIDDIAKDIQDQHVVEESVSHYVSLVHIKRHLIDLTYLDMESNTATQLDTHRPLVVGLGQKEAQYSSLCGAKAASLAQLLHYQINVKPEGEFKVPNGLILTRHACDLILELNPNVALAQQRLASAVNQGNQDDINYHSEQIRKMFYPSDGENHTKVNVPEQLINELKQTMLTTFGIDDLSQSEKPFAVRSSSWGEDDQDMSAAGQLTTLLSIKGLDQLCEAVLICFASKYSPTNVEYKHQRGLPIDMPMGIVIQEMIECDKAGVLFTSDPINGDERRMVITANYGLGESVVSGAADPDTIVIGGTVDQQEPNDFSKRRLDSSRQIVTVGKKKVIMTGNSINLKQSEEYGLSKKDSTQSEQQSEHEQLDLVKCCVTDEEITKLANCAIELVGYFRCARDIEWGLKDGQLYLFQSRPLTGLDTMNEFELLHEFSQGVTAETEWLTRANVGEVMPLPVSPLSLTYCFRFWGISGSHQFVKLGLQKLDEWYPNRTGEVLNMGYFSFFNLRPSKLFCFGGGKNRALEARAMEIGIFGHEVEESGLAEACADLIKPVSSYTIWKSRILSMPMRYSPNKIISRVRKESKNLRQDILEHKFVKSSSLPDLFAQMNLILPNLINGFESHLSATMLSSEYNHETLALLSKFIDDPMELFACYSRLLSSNSDVFSARVPRMIKKMSEIIAAKGLEKLKSFLAMNDIDSLDYISNDDAEGELKKLFDKFLEEYGHRSYNEFDIRSPRWRENPAIVIEMIKQSCQSQLMDLENDKSTLQDENKIHTEESANHLLEDIMRSRFSFMERLKMNHFILPKCHSFVDIRERTKDLAIYQMDCLRSAASILAKEMQNQGRLPDADLIFYMTYDEVKMLSERAEPSIVMHAQRRRRFIQKIELWKYDEIMRGHDFMPCHLTNDNEEAIKLAESLKHLPKIVGTPASSGQAEGRVCIVSNYKQLNKVKPGDILVTYSTDISFSPVFPLLAGIVTEIGGMISHGAVIAREYGLPTLIGVANACSIFEDGERIILDANHGHILRLDLEPKD